MRSVHVGYRLLAGLFVLGALLQFFLAGLGVFHSESVFEIHGIVGTVLWLVALVLCVLAIVLAASGRLARKAAGAAVLLLALMTVQYLLVELFAAPAPPLAALHPVNGVLVLGLGALIASGLRQINVPIRESSHG